MIFISRQCARGIAHGKRAPQPGGASHTSREWPSCLSWPMKTVKTLETQY
jgi:hypothetical protein